MSGWLAQLRDDLSRLEAGNLLRELTPAQPQGRLIHVAGRDLINLGSNDYLGLANHPRLRDAAIAAIRDHGTGSGASRLAGGTSPLHQRVEERLAQFKHAPPPAAALLCPTGYMANLAVLTALAGPGDLLCLDKLNHASLIDAARASGATVRVFPHLNYTKLERLLQDRVSGVGYRGSGEDETAPPSYASPRRPSTPNSPSPTPHTPHPKPDTRPSRSFIVTDSVFSMDGDTADLPALCALAKRYDAILIVDEAHGTGVLGASGSGLCEEQGVRARVDVVVSTASKALGGLGGIVTARREVIDTLVNHARSFIYTTAVPPAQAAAIEAALDVLRDEPQRRARLRDMATHVRSELAQLGWLPPLGDGIPTPIVPLIVGDPAAALALAERLQQARYFAPAIRPPTVAPNAARMRLSLRADLTDRDVDGLLDVLGSAVPAPARGR